MQPARRGVPVAISRRRAGRLPQLTPLRDRPGDREHRDRRADRDHGRAARRGGPVHRGRDSAAVGARDEVLALAGDEVPVVDIGEDVAYPGFIDAHAHWIGDREYYGIESPAAAMDAALSRGWTSISEQWVNPERLDELEAPRRRRRPADPRRRLPRPELRRPSSSATGTPTASPGRSATPSASRA